MRVRDKEMNLLIHIRDNPLMSYNEISKMFSLAPNTVKSNIDKLKKLGLIQDDLIIHDEILGERNTSEVVGIISPSKIGLYKYFAVLEGLFSKDEQEQLNKHLNNHPYLTRKTFMVSNDMGFFLEFQVPQKGKKLVHKFLSELKQNGLFREFSVFDPERNSSSKLKFEYWDPEELTWHSNGMSVIDLFTMKFEKLMQQNFNDTSKEDFIVRPKINSLDLNIMRELTINAKPKINVISPFYEKDRTTISRRIAKVRNKYMDGYEIRYNSSAFHLNSNVILTGGGMESKNIDILHYLLKNNEFPFKSNIYTRKDKFMWLIEAESSEINALIIFLRPYLKELKFMNLQNETEKQYFKYDHNFDTSNKKWLVSEDILLNNLLPY